MQVKSILTRLLSVATIPAKLNNNRHHLPQSPIIRSNFLTFLRDENYRNRDQGIARKKFLKIEWDGGE